VRDSGSMADRPEGDGAVAPESSNALAAIINLLSFVTAAERTLRLAAIVRASLSRSIISVPAVRHRKV
jgi:hypothetical protein